MAGKKKQAQLTPEEKLQQALVPEAEQPYKVPANWCWVKAPFIFNIEYGKGLSSKELLEKGYPVFGANGQIGYYNEYMFENAKALMSCRGAYSGTMNLSLPKSFVTSNSLIIDSKGAGMSEHFTYFLFSALNKKSIISGSAQPQITVQAFAKYPIPLPPLPEQQRIVERIESLFAKLDEAKENLQNVLDGFETRKAAILHKAFTGELTANWRKQHGVSMDSWEEKKLGDVADTQYGYTESASSEAIGPKFLRITDIQNGIVNWDKVPYCRISEEELEKYKLSIEDIVIARTGATTGKSYLIKDNILSVFASYLIRLKLKTKDVLSNFIYQFMQSQLYWTQITDFSKGIAQPGVNAQKLKEIKLLLPTFPEQTEIVRIIDDLLVKEQQAKELAENTIAKIDLIKKSILARAFRSELGTNNLADEPAVELLKRVL